MELPQDISHCRTTQIPVYDCKTNARVPNKFITISPFQGGLRIRINLSCWIRIRIQIAEPDPDSGRQKWPTKIEIVQNFNV
jgi:hypothetical protein